jgi:ankyrin repeat protein
MSNYLISKFGDNIPKEYLNSLITIKTDIIRNEIIKHFFVTKDKEIILFLIQNDMITKSMSLDLFQFIVHNKFWDMFFDLDYNKLNINADNDLALRKSSEYGNIDVVKFLVGKGANIRTCEDYALRYSSQYGHIEVVKFLVEKGSDIHMCDDYALRYSSQYGHIEVVKFLIGKGANIHASDDYAFKLSSRVGNIEIVKFLFENGANIHAGNNFAIRYSSCYGHIEVVKFLVQNGANVHANIDEALVCASNNKHIEIVKILLYSDLEYFSTNKTAAVIVKNHNLLEFYEKFKIDLDIVQLSKISQTPCDIHRYINSIDLESIKKCNEFDFSSYQYYYFFKALESNNYEILKVIFDFIQNKEELKIYIDDISFIFDENIKNNYKKLFKNIELEKIKTKIDDLLSEIKELDHI